ncbi:unnamed protein product [Prorocentrum cordatum]|uniref:Uncharacterized protein n=1 Tax=Prorocentrum cordatum TaxID=2364126 RepID=A0ABN9WYE9_9DINO|nr:unnamed protein product [Polarella glacialis]
MARYSGSERISCCSARCYCYCCCCCPFSFSSTFRPSFRAPLPRPSPSLFPAAPAARLRPPPAAAPLPRGVGAPWGPAGTAQAPGPRIAGGGVEAEAWIDDDEESGGSVVASAVVFFLHFAATVSV